ncbi:ABC transporter permease [Corynebacterium glucuronolyticum]
MGTFAKISWRSARSHPVRMLMCILAVVLGTSFVSGAFMLTATMTKAFDDIIYAEYEGVDVVITGTKDYQLTLSSLIDIENIDGVKEARPVDSIPIILLDKDGEAVGSGGAGTWVIADHDHPDEYSINTSAVERTGIHPGDTITVVHPGGRQEITLEKTFEEEFATGGWVGINVPRADMERIYTDGVHTSTIEVVADGIPQWELRDMVAKKFPDAKVRTGVEAADEKSKTLREQLSFITYIVLAFGLVAMFVATFLIANTFSMLVAERTREFALLRAIGASRAQVTLGVLLESALIGMVGSVLGILFGVVIVRVIYSLMNSAGFGFPDAGVGLDTASIVIPLLVGVLVTCISALSPAMRAGRLHPVQAMRTGDTSTRRPLTVRTILGAVLLLAGIVASFFSVGPGAVLVLLGILLVTPALVRRLFDVRGGGIIGLLARTNLSRNPTRTASTAFALTLGVGLVAAASVFGQSMAASTTGTVTTKLEADVVVTPASLISSTGVPQAVNRDLRDVLGVEALYADTSVPVRIAGTGTGSNGEHALNSVLTSDPTAIMDVTLVDGSFAEVSSELGVGFDTITAHSLGVTVGDTVPVDSDHSSEVLDVPVVVIWEPGSVLPKQAVTLPVAERLVSDRKDWFSPSTYVKLSDDSEATRAEIQLIMDDYKVVEQLTLSEYADVKTEQIAQFLYVVYALLALAVIIAILGIVNTLALSIIERTKEFAMLRGVGLQRSQMWRMVTTESILIALTGSLLGVLIGGFIGWRFVVYMAGNGIDVLVVPWGTLALLAVAGVIVGLFASLIPATKAAATNPLD